MVQEQLSCVLFQRALRFLQKSTTSSLVLNARTNSAFCNSPFLSLSSSLKRSIKSIIEPAQQKGLLHMCLSYHVSIYLYMFCICGEDLYWLIVLDAIFMPKCRFSTKKKIALAGRRPPPPSQWRPAARRECPAAGRRPPRPVSREAAP